MIEKFQQERLAQQNRRGTLYKPSSVNREFEVMKRIFNLALREEMIDRTPCFKVSKLSEVNARDRILSYGEFQELTEELPSHAADILRMGYYTGMRFGEIVGLTWDRVNLKEGYLTLRSEDTKTEKPRRVYLVPQAFEVLEGAKKVRGIQHNRVFTYRGQPIKSIKTALKSAMKKTGVKDFRFHDLRHTFNTNMQKAGVKDTVTMKMTGHRTLSMFVRYSTVEVEEARKAMAKFSDFLDLESRITSNSTSQKNRGQATSPNPS
jgi:integrase